MVKTTQSTSLHTRLADLETRLSKLEARRLIAGSNIRINDIGGGNLLVEADVPDQLSYEVQERLLDTENTLASIQSSLVLADDEQAETGRNRLLPQEDYSFLTESSETGTDYPFRVRVEGRAKGYGESTNLLVCGDGTGNLDALVFAGIRDAIHVSQRRFSVSSACYIVLRLTSASNTAGTETIITAELNVTSSLYDVSNRIYIVPIAQIEYSSGKATVHQLQFGNIFVAGRVV